MRGPRIAVARVWHEANSFTPVPTRLADFEQREWWSGDAAVRSYRGTRTEIGAAVDFADAHPDWQIEFLPCCAATPGGVVEAAAADCIRARLIEALREGPWDGVYLSLHGAMIAANAPSFELSLLRAVRQRVGRVPIAASFDLHGNLPAELAGLIDMATGYRTHPHVDMYEAGTRALAMLERAVSGQIRPVVAIAKVAAVLPSHNMRTAAGPMREIEDEAARLEVAEGLLDVTPFGGFAYADTPSAGAAAVVTADTARHSAQTAGAVAEALAAFIFERRGAFAVALPDAPAGLRSALAQPPVAGKPVALVEPADNPLSGGIGDTTGLLRAMLAGAADLPCAFAFFHDPALAARAHAGGAGAILDCRLGGRLAPQFGAPIEVSARVQKLTDGRFVNLGPMEAGLPVDLGATAVLTVGPMQIVITSSCQSPNDPAWFALHGIDLSALRLLGVKGKNHFRAAFASRCAQIIDVDTPGPASADLRALPFRQVPRRLLV